MTSARGTLHVLNGPNLNLLGEREPHIYGADTLGDVEELARRTGGELGFDVECFQSNHEGALVDEIQRIRRTSVGVVINAGAYTHTSVAIRDALANLQAPFVEVHISNVHAREQFRHHSYLSDKAAAVIVGCGVQGYEFAVRRLDALVPGGEIAV
ncbi:type II 3-dehydroquinate dehydratase [Dermacoccus abyssi]